jgi:hypothetical protein
MAAYLPVLDISRPFAMLLHELKSAQGWESHVVEDVENN